MGSWLVPPIVIPVLIVIMVVVYGLLSWTPKTRQVAKVEPCP